VVAGGVLRITAPGLKPATFADSKSLAVGDLTLAIGNPLGLQSSVSEGIVSALVNLEGQVIGIPTLAATDPQPGGGQAPGIGFAIPSNIVRNIAGQLASKGTVSNTRRGSLGVQVATTTSGAVLVTPVLAGSPAAMAGIRAGQLITTEPPHAPARDHEAGEVRRVTR
jgi:S1-C subfamily serine protease